jgi:drug/metabolite transporter (DMT)-like permease
VDRTGPNTLVAEAGSAAAHRGTRVALLLAALPPLFWAGNFLVARAMRDAIPPFQMSFWRWALAFVILIPFSWSAARKEGARLRLELPFLAVLGLVGVTAFNCFVYAALQHTTVVNGALINSLMPAATFLFALVLLREPLPVQRVLGLAVSFAGAVAIIAGGRPDRIGDLTFNRGDLLILFGLTFWAAYTVLIRWYRTKLSPVLFLAATAGLGTVFHLPLVAWEAATTGGFSLSPATGAAILYLAVFPSVLAYIFWNQAVATLGPGRTAIFMHLMPIFSVVLAVVFLGERLYAYHVIGALLIVSGITLVTRPRAVQAAA